MYNVFRYRDVILVDNVEAVVIKQAKFAVRKSSKIFEENSFIGCSMENDECKLFVNFVGGGLEVTYPFGHYWFKFNAVNYIPNIGINFEIGENIYQSCCQYYIFSHRRHCPSVCEL